MRRGYLFGLAAYLMWGFFPLYFRLLREAGPAEILAHRIAWSLAFTTLAVVVARRLRVLAALARRPRAVAGLALTAVLVAVNWGLFIYGVNSGQVVETSLGYFINPLVTVLLGVLVQREHLRRRQWIAVGVATAAVGVLTVDYGRLPWLALSLAVTFGLYGLVKKRVGAPALEGLLVEAAVLTLPAIAYLIWLGPPSHRPMTWTLLVVSGAITAVPLTLFAGAANRIPLTALGLMQYVTPTMHLTLGVAVFHEPMPPPRLAGFVLVWLALVLLTWDALRNARRARLVAEPAP